MSHQDLSQRLSTLEDKVPPIDQLVDSHHSQLDRLQKQLASLDDIFDRTRARVTKAENDVAENVAGLKDA